MRGRITLPRIRNNTSEKRNNSKNFIQTKFQYQRNETKNEKNNSSAFFGFGAALLIGLSQTISAEEEELEEKEEEREEEENEKNNKENEENKEENKSEENNNKEEINKEISEEKEINLTMDIEEDEEKVIDTRSLFISKLEEEYEERTIKALEELDRQLERDIYNLIREKSYERNVFEEEIYENQRKILEEYGNQLYKDINKVDNKIAHHTDDVQSKRKKLERKFFESQLIYQILQNSESFIGHLQQKGEKWEENQKRYYDEKLNLADKNIGKIKHLLDDDIKTIRFQALVFILANKIKNHLPYKDDLQSLYSATVRNGNYYQRFAIDKIPSDFAEIGLPADKDLISEFFVISGKISELSAPHKDLLSKCTSLVKTLNFEQAVKELQATKDHQIISPFRDWILTVKNRNLASMVAETLSKI